MRLIRRQWAYECVWDNPVQLMFEVGSTEACHTCKSSCGPSSREIHKREGTNINNARVRWNNAVLNRRLFCDCGLRRVICTRVSRCTGPFGVFFFPNITVTDDAAFSCRSGRVSEVHRATPYLAGMLVSVIENSADSSVSIRCSAVAMLRESFRPRPTLHPRSCHGHGQKWRLASRPIYYYGKN